MAQSKYFHPLDLDRFTKVLARFKLAPEGFQSSVRPDGVNLAQFTTALPADLDKLRTALFALPEVGWATLRPEGDRLRVELIGETRHFGQTAVLAALRAIRDQNGSKLPLSSSSTTRIRGWHNINNGYKTTKSPGTDTVEISYYGGEVPPEKWAYLRGQLEARGFAVENQPNGLLVLGFA
jgi:hypothetical protein